jgi:hypothetical protein
LFTYTSVVLLFWKIFIRSSGVQEFRSSGVQESGGRRQEAGGRR